MFNVYMWDRGMLYDGLPEYRCQLTVLACTTAFAAISLKAGASLLARALDSHTMKALVIARSQANYRRVRSVVSDEEVWRIHCSLYIVALLHLLCALLIAPALAGVGDAHTMGKLAIVGVLVEVGYDLWDCASSWHRHVCRGDLPGGRIALAVLTFHHQLSIALALPMNLHFGTDMRYLRVAFGLAAAGGLGLLASTCGQLVDTRSVSGVMRIRALSSFDAALTFAARVVDYPPQCARFVSIVGSDPGKRWLLWPGVAALGGMGLFNIFLTLVACARMVKYWRMRPGDRVSEEARAVPVGRHATIKEQ
mmetsp:Transcript_9908/g.23876  ORF Transcript_9908/g.23876 Transcript_9908/m.23876 type:complete len:308 (-) Transcript_9908:164-1087(-)